MIIPEDFVFSMIKTNRQGGEMKNLSEVSRCRTCRKKGYDNHGQDLCVFFQRTLRHLEVNGLHCGAYSPKIRTSEFPKNIRSLPPVKNSCVI